MKCTDCGSEDHKAGYLYCPGRKVANKVVVNEAVPNVPNRTESARVGEWKKKNAEKVRAYQKEYMRKRRK